jgi:ABC-type dipeptide/oligopeptide/nickel transport system ATPase component
MEAQLCKALEGIMEHEKVHLIIQGSEGCGKTMLATSIIRVLQKECGRPNGKVGKIYAEALNKKDIQQLLKKVAGGCLIIEKAGEINRQTAVALSLLLEQDTTGILVIIEDTAAGIEKALSVDDSFAKRFTETVTVPLFKVEDFVIFACAYANELGYVIDEMATLALHNRITSIEKLNQATKLEEIKEIIDGAIYCEAHSGLRKFMGILTANRYTDDEKIVLREKDFE